MKRLIVCMLFFVSLLSVFSQTGAEQSDAAELEKMLVDQSSQTTSIRCGFRQTKNMSVMAKPVESEGYFYYSQPDRICLDYATPEGDKLVMNEDKFMIIANGRKNVADARTNPMMKALKNMLSSCMSGNVADMVRGGKNNVTYEKSGNTYKVTIDLDKKKTRGTLKRMILSFDSGDLSLSEMVMEEFSGDNTVYKFFNKEFNIDLDESLFSVSTK